MAEKLMNWLIRSLRGTWITVTLLMTLISVLIYGFQRANWVRDEAVLSAAFTVGILFGWMLSRSRFHGLVAALYGLVIGVVTAVEGIGKVLPSLGEFFTNSAGEVIEQMNLRIVSVSLRINGWIETLQAGENVEDPALFVGLFSLLLTLCGVWLMWNLLRKRNVLLGLLPVGVLYAVNMHLSRQTLLYYGVFLLCVLLLVARTEYNRQHEEWERRQVDYPEQLGLEWGLSALAAALVIVLIARAAPLLGTPEGWRAISEWVNRANAQTSETATRLFSGVNPPPPAPGIEPQVIVNTPNMGEIGAPLPQGMATVMWVTTSDPPPLPRGVPEAARQQAVRTHYWRNGIFDTYTGRGWEPAEVEAVSTPPIDEEPPDPPVGRYALRQTFEIAAQHNGTLFSVNDPIQASEEIGAQATVPDGSKLLRGEMDAYAVLSSATRVSATQLASGSQDYPEEIRAVYLQLPDTLPERVRTLASRAAAGAENPYRKAVQIQNYLRENFEYDLGIRGAPPRRDVVDYFLFDVQAGFCSHYATAMTVMLRAVDVPARVVTGYAMGEFDSEAQAFRVPESASHAWVEVYFPEFGWIEFEPTAGRDPITYAEDFAASPAENVEQEPVLEQEQPAEPQPVFYALVAGAAILLLGLPVLLMRMFAAARQPPVVQIETLYRRIRRALRWAGMGSPGSVTPDEYLALHGKDLERYETMHKALRQATDLYRETVFSPHPPEAFRIRGASILWQRSLREWLTLWLRTAWSKIRARLREQFGQTISEERA